MGAQQQGGKGNPAHKRMMNPANKIRRALSWKRGEEKKKKNNAKNLQQAKKNKELRERGELTPWEASQVARRAARKLK